MVFVCGNSLSAIQRMKSVSSVALKILVFLKNVSGSCFLLSSVSGISLMLTDRPFSIASVPASMTTCMPWPYGSPFLGGSASGRKHTLLAMRLMVEKCVSFHADPSAATVLYMPIDCKRIQSGAPSTRNILSCFAAVFQASSMPKSTVDLWKMSESELFRYLGCCSSMQRAVKPITCPKRSCICMTIRFW